jgi:hypothetical protein
MNSVDSVMRSANPIPDPQMDIDDAAIQSLLTLTLTRSTDMDVKEVTRPVHKQEKQPNRWWMAAVAFAVVIVAVGVAVLLIPNGSDSPPATTDVSPTTVPQASETSTTLAASPESDVRVMTAAMLAYTLAAPEAYNTGDVEAFAELLAPGFVRYAKGAPDLTLSADQILDELVNMHAQQSTVEIGECRPSLNSMTCTTTISGPVEEALYQIPIRSTDTVYFNDDGKVTKIETGLPAVDFNQIEVFRAWMKATHPEVYAQMVEPGFLQVLANDDSEIYLEWAPIWADLGRPTS